LVPDGVGADLELDGLRRSGRAEAAREDAVLVGILAVAVPRHHEVAVGIHGDRGETLVPLGERVDLELATDRRARGGIALQDDAGPRAVLPVAVPDHDEVAVVLARD